MIGLRSIPVPPEEAHGQRGHASDEAVRVHHSPSSSSLSQVTGHHQCRRKRTKRDVRDALPGEPTAWPGVGVGFGCGGGGNSQEQHPAADGSSPRRGHHRKGRTHEIAGGAQSQHGSRRQRPNGIGAVVVVDGGGGNERRPAARSSSPGGGRASDDAAAASDPSPGLIRQPAAAPTRHVHAPEPAKATRLRSASAASEPDDDEFFSRGVLAFGKMDTAHKRAEVNDYACRQRQEQLPQGSGFSFWLTAERSRADVEYGYRGRKNA